MLTQTCAVLALILTGAGAQDACGCAKTESPLCDTQCGAGISAECMACRQCCSADEYCAGPGFSNFYCARYNAQYADGGSGHAPCSDFACCGARNDNVCSKLAEGDWCKAQGACEPDAAVEAAAPTIPAGCITWHDGCNDCTYRRGDLACTEMACFTQGEAFCKTWRDGSRCTSADHTSCSGGSGATPAAAVAAASAPENRVGGGAPGGYQETFTVVDPAARADPTALCEGGVQQQCRRMCPTPVCPANQCFMKTDNCCAGTCEAPAPVQPTVLCEGGVQQQCRRMCPTPVCPASQCFMKTDNCCAGRCEAPPYVVDTMPVDRHVDPMPPTSNRVGASCGGFDEMTGTMGAACAAGLTCYTDPNMVCAGSCSGVCTRPTPTTSNPSCWSGAYTADRCCKGAAGDASCWSGRYTFAFCCNGHGH